MWRKIVPVYKRTPFSLNYLHHEHDDSLLIAQPPLDHKLNILFQNVGRLREHS